MKILVVNANTSDDVTAVLHKTAGRFAGPETAIETVTAPFGGRYIATPAEIQIAGHAALVVIARHWSTADAIVIGCFGDVGLEAARNVVPIPVVGMAEAAMLMAPFYGNRFSIITGGAAWAPILERMAWQAGHGERLASVRTTIRTAGDYQGDRSAALNDLRDLAMQCVEEDGAEVIIPGGAGFADLIDDLASMLPVPVVDSMAASIGMAEQLARQPTRMPTSREPRETTGLDAALSALLAAPERFR